MLLGKILMRPEKFQFTDASGRMWDNRTYCEMLSRTVLLNAGRQTYFDSCAENGCDVVRVTVSGNPCPDCAVWENRLLSISGSTPKLPTVEEALAAGLCHPNCTHSFVAVGDEVRGEDFKADGRPKDGLNSPGKEAKNDKAAWARHRESRMQPKARKAPSDASKSKSAPRSRRKRERRPPRLQERKRKGLRKNTAPDGRNKLSAPGKIGFNGKPISSTPTELKVSILASRI